MAMITCEFNFERLSRVYYGGEHIVGHCVLRTTGEYLEFQGLSVKLIGLCSLKWKEKSTKLAEPQQHNDCEVPASQYDWHHVDEEFYCKAQPIQVLGNVKAIKVPFHFIVPSDKPAWLRLPYVKIYYHIQTIMQRTALKEYKFTKNVYIKQRLDLNKPEIRALLLEQYPRDCDNGFVGYLVDQEAYVPGQLIHYGLKISRLCNYHKVWMSLLQVVRCKTGNPAYGTKQFANVLMENKHTPQQNEAIVRDYLPIPLTVPISTLGGSQVEISYAVRCLMVNKQKSVMQLLKLPIVIGTVPLPKPISNQKYKNDSSFVNLGSVVINGQLPAEEGLKQDERATTDENRQGETERLL